MKYRYELWDEYPLEGEYKGIQINEIPARVVINAWVNGQILLSDYCLKMLIVELQETWDKLSNLQQQELIVDK